MIIFQPNIYIVNFSLLKISLIVVFNLQNNELRIKNLGFFLQKCLAPPLHHHTV